MSESGVGSYPKEAPVRSIGQASHEERLVMLRFAIRDLLWLTVVVALGLGWRIDKERVLESKAIAVKDARYLLEVLTDPFADYLSEDKRLELLARYFPCLDTRHWTGNYWRFQKSNPVPNEDADERTLGGRARKDHEWSSQKILLENDQCSRVTPRSRVWAFRRGCLGTRR